MAVGAISALSVLALGWSRALHPLAVQTHPHRLNGRLTAISPALHALRVRSPVALESAELIDKAVAISTFAPQPFWLLMIALPRARVTRALMEPLAPIIGLGLVHFAVVVTAASQQDGTAPITIFFDVFDPAQNQLDGMERLFSFRNFVAEEWPYANSTAAASHTRSRRLPPILLSLVGRIDLHSRALFPPSRHVLIWDLFVGRAIWMAGVSRGFPIWLMAPAITLTNFIGPPGEQKKSPSSRRTSEAGWARATAPELPVHASPPRGML
jgi:hypothetical protein